MGRRGYQTGLKILADFTVTDRPPAIFAASGAIAIGLLQAAFQMGLAIPRQLSLIGFDNLNITPFTVPPLTTISQSGLEMGQTTANLLLDMINQNRTSPEIGDIVLSLSLIFRYPYRGYKNRGVCSTFYKEVKSY